MSFLGGLGNIGSGLVNIAAGAVTGDGDQVEEGVNQCSDGIDEITETTNEVIDNGADAVCDTGIEALCSTAQAVGTGLQAGIELAGFGAKALVEIFGAAAKVPGCLVRLSLECVLKAFRDARDGISDNWQDLFDYQICGGKFERNVPSVKRTASSCFSIAGSTVYNQDNQRSLFIGTGRRYDFEIRNGKVYYCSDAQGETPGSFKLLKPDNSNDAQCINYFNHRSGELLKSPRFDMVAASSGRVFAKEKGKDQFYFLLCDEMFQKKRARDGETEVVAGPPSAYFQIDPEYNAPGNNPEDLTDHLCRGHHDHPAGVRFGLFREVVRAEQMDFMVVTVQILKWHRIESRPPLLIIGDESSPTFSSILTMLLKARGIALNIVNYVGQSFQTRKLNVAAMLKIAKRFQLEAVRSSTDKSNPPAWRGLSTYEHIIYCPTATGKLLGVKKEIRKSIKFFRVLDIGVGHVHFHEQYDRRFGGEIQPILSKHPWAMNENINSITYKFLNGPVRDGDGFIDGTCTYYIMVQLKEDPEKSLKDAYAILMMDEQMYFSQRWRLAHPDDHKGLNFSLFNSLQALPSVYEFERKTYWCPFRAGHITGRSRMAVSRQVILVNGIVPDEGSHRLYSINISWATCDHTWRWRDFPGSSEGIRYLSKDDVATGSESIKQDDSIKITVYPQTTRLREDMTMHIKGTKLIDGKSFVGRWYQYYLPADNQHVPSRQDLHNTTSNGENLPLMPVARYDHPWHFLPEQTFRKVDKFHFWGVYQTVDSRSQYYRISFSQAQDIQNLEAIPENTKWVCEEGLHVPTWRLKFPENADSQGNIDPIELFQLHMHDANLEPQVEYIRSLIDDQVSLKIVHRGPIGWIAMHWEKHNDDFDTFDLLPRRVSIHPEAVVDIGQLPDELGIVVEQQIDVWSPPIVQEAGVRFERVANSEKIRAFLSFKSVQAESLLAENIWKIKMGALRENGDVKMLLDVTRHDHFYKTEEPNVYEFSWMLTTDQIEQYQKYCCRDGYLAHGTSIWFENIVGHTKVADMTHFPLGWV